MERYRFIPFGYRLIDGEIVIHSSEVECVRRAFAAYANGSSYATIADNLQASGICYHADTSAWNKNMVKRMLENERYTGTDGYPVIIPKELFKEVADIRAERSVKCERRGKQMKPSSPPPPPTVPNRLTDISIVRLENQINKELSKPVLEPERIQEMIFQLAVKKYEAIRNYNSIQSNQVDANSVHFDI